MGFDCCDTNPDGAIGEDSAAVDANESLEFTSETADSISTNFHPGKNGGKVGSSPLKCLNKSSIQIQKPPHRRSHSPLNWFPRVKVDSFLKRKIQLLQETEGMRSSLDETLGSANPHYTRIAREKIAAQEAAKKAMKARKAAMIEASWCRILHAARIHNKDAEEKLEKAEREVEEAFEEASSMGVMMYDRPDCPRRMCEIERSSIIGGVSSHTIAASFETAFEVDKEVAMAVKNAFIRMARCPSSSKKDEFKDLIHKISENPEEVNFDQNVDHGDISSYGSSDAESKQNLVNLKFNPSSFSKKKEFQQLNDKNGENPEEDKMDQNVDHGGLISFESTNVESKPNSVNSMSDRVATSKKEDFKELNDTIREHPEEVEFDQYVDHGDLRSFRTTCVESNQNSVNSMSDPSSKKECNELNDKIGAHPEEVEFNQNVDHGDLGTYGSTDAESNQNLVNSMSDCVSSSKNKECKELNDKISENLVDVNLDRNFDHGLMDIESKQNLVNLMFDRLKHLSEDEIASLAVIVATTGLNAALERTNGPTGPITTHFSLRNHRVKRREAVTDFPSLDKFLVKHVSKLEKEVREAKISKKTETDKTKNPGNGFVYPDLGSILVKHVSRLEREIHSFKDSLKKQKISGVDSDERENMDVNRMEREGKVLRHDSSLEREKMSREQNLEPVNSEALEGQSLPVIPETTKSRRFEKTQTKGLDQILVKHQSKLEKAKLDAAKQDWSTPTLEPKKKDQNLVVGPSLEQILIKHQSTLEKSNSTAILRSTEEKVKTTSTWREARDQKLQEEWGGLSLANSLKPHLSRLEREKAAWKRAEEEEVRRARAL